MMDFNKIKTLIITIYSLTLCTAIIEVLVKLRLFNEALGYNLANLKLAYTNAYVCICMTTLLFHSILIMWILYGIYKNVYHIPIKDKYISIIKIFQKFIDYIYWNPLEYLNKIISPHIPYSGLLIVTYSKFTLRWGHSTEMAPIIFQYLPRIFMSLLFCIEIIFYNQIYYFVHFLPILLIPLIYQIFIKLCKSFIENNLPDVEKHLIVTPSPFKEHTIKGICMYYQIKLTPKAISQGATKADLNDLNEMWWELHGLKLITNRMEKFRTLCGPYVTLLCSILYALTFSYKIWYLLI